MSEPVYGDPKIDANGWETVAKIKELASGFMTKRNFSYSLLSAYADAFNMPETLLFIYEKFVQSEPRRLDIVMMSIDEIRAEYGPVAAIALQLQGFEALKQKYRERLTEGQYKAAKLIYELKRGHSQRVQ